MVQTTYSFLFDSSAPSLGSLYGAACDKAFLCALKAALEDSELYTRLCRGDIRVDSLARRSTRFRRTGRITSFQEDVDIDLAITLACEIATTTRIAAESLTSDRLAAALLTWNVYAVTATHLPLSLAGRIDARLRQDSGNGYIGAIEVDRDSPLERQLFVDGLFSDFAIASDMLLVRDTEEGEILSWGQHSETGFGVTTMRPDVFERAAPEMPGSACLSNRGRTLLDVLRRKRRHSLRDRLVRELLRIREFPRDFALDDDPSTDGAVVPRPKLVDFALKLDHVKGGPHATLFRDLLAIEGDDWRFLQEQLARGILTAPIENVRATEHGIQFDALVPVIGRNRITKMIQTGWIVRVGEAPQLATPYIARRNKQSNGVPAVAAVLPLGLDGAEKWRALIDTARVAGEQAAAEVLPTPMFVGVDDRAPWIEREGLCGGAWVVIRDGRTRFARWLRESNIGYRHARSGWAVGAAVKSQSKDRAEAYARAMEHVLQANGIDCFVDSYLA